MKKKVKKIKKKIKVIHVLPLRPIKVLFIVLPAIVSFLWLINLKLTQKTIIIAKEGIMLAPPKDTQQLALGLLIFTIGYIIFLFLIFFSNIKQAFEELISRIKP